MYHIEIKRASGWERIDGRMTLEAAVPVALQHETDSGKAVRIVDDAGCDYNFKTLSV